MTGLASQIVEIQEMDLASLRQAWGRWHQTPPPRGPPEPRSSHPGPSTTASRRVPKAVYPMPIRRQLRRLAKEFAETGRVTPDTNIPRLPSL